MCIATALTFLRSDENEKTLRLLLCYVIECSARLLSADAVSSPRAHWYSSLALGAITDACRLAKYSPDWCRQDLYTELELFDRSGMFNDTLQVNRLLLVLATLFANTPKHKNNKTSVTNNYSDKRPETRHLER